MLMHKQRRYSRLIPGRLARNVTQASRLIPNNCRLDNYSLIDFLI